MKVLVVFPQPPFLEGGAAGRCGAALLRGLHEHGLDVRSVAARHSDSAEAGILPTGPNIEVIDVPRANGLVARLRKIARPRGELSWGEFEARVQAHGAWADVVHLAEIDTYACGRGISAPTIVQLEYLIRSDRSYGKPWTKQFREVAELALAETLAVRRHRVVIANSPQVATDLKKAHSRCSVTVVPLALIPDGYAAAPLTDSVAGMIGTAAWPTTAAAIRRLTTRIWPEVQRRSRNSRLLIAGRGTAGMTGLDLSSNVSVVGTVASASGFLQRLGILLFPITNGSGMKVKVLEAMACGVPVVTTPVGAEGIAPTDGVVVCESDEEIVERAVGLLSDRDERIARGAAARAAFFERHTPRIAVEPLLSLYEGLRTA